MNASIRTVKELTITLSHAEASVLAGIVSAFSPVQENVAEGTLDELREILVDYGVAEDDWLVFDEEQAPRPFDRKRVLKACRNHNVTGGPHRDSALGDEKHRADWHEMVNQCRR